MTDAFKPVRDFESAVCAYVRAPFCVAVNSCSMAIFLAIKWHMEHSHGLFYETDGDAYIEIPTHSYISVPMAIRHAGGFPRFRKEGWFGSGLYQLKPLPVWDSARCFTSGMYQSWCVGNKNYENEDGTAQFSGGMLCFSFQANKILGDSQGGCIVHDSAEADAWLRRARFDGRSEGVPPSEDTFNMLGWHCYMSPDVAARLLWKLSRLPMHNAPLPPDKYPDLSQIGLFK